MKTKIILIFLLTCLIPFKITKGQCYTIISVKGEILLEKTGLPIQEMDEICANDKLIFTTPDSKAAVYSAEQGRFVIKLSGKKKENKIVMFVKSVLVEGSSNLSSRGDFGKRTGDLFGEITDFQVEFGDEYFVAGTYKLIIDTRTYPMDDNNFFLVKYLYKGEMIEKKLKSLKDTLYIDKETIYNVNDVIINQEKIDTVRLFYFDKERKTRTKIAAFKLIFANEQILNKEVFDYVSLLKRVGKDTDNMIDEVCFFLNDVYGNINKPNMKIWLEANAGLK